MSDSIALAIKPIVRYPRVAQVGKTYLMTIDLEVESGSEWNYEEEEYPIYCTVDSELFKTQIIGEPVIILHRFGGSYGEAKFLLTAAAEARQGNVKVGLINAWGVPVKTINLEGVQLLLREVAHTIADIEGIAKTSNPLPTTPDPEKSIVKMVEVQENAKTSTITGPVALVITTLPVEYLAVRSHLVDLREEMHSQGTIYERGKFAAIGQMWDVGIAEVGAGNAGAAVEAERAIAYFKPNIMFFVGIAGGIKDVEIGDVVAATDVYAYEIGRVEGQAFLTRPKTGSSAYTLVQRAKSEARKGEWLQRLSQSGSLQPRVFVAPIAAGEKVIASKESEIFKFIRVSYNDAVAVEMEGFGFLQAAFAYPNIQAIVIRGISDLIKDKNLQDPKKGTEDQRQREASHNASAFAFEVLAKLEINVKDSSQSRSETTILNINPQQKQRLEKKKETLQAEWNIRNEKLGQLRQAYAIELSIAVRFQLEKSIQDEENLIGKLEDELTDIEQPLQQATAPNFFAYDDSWVGRNGLIQDLSDRVNCNCRLMLLLGMTGIGKTALGERLAVEMSDWIDADWSKYHQENFDDERQPSDFLNVAARWLEKWRELVTPDDRKDPQRLLNRLIKYLSENRYLIQIDSLENILQGNEEEGWSDFKDEWWVKFFEAYLKLPSCQSIIMLTSQDLPGQLQAIGTRAQNFWHCQPLSGLNQPEQFHLFEKVGLDISEASEGKSYLARIGNIYEGHPLALRVIAGEIKSQPFNGKVSAYWKRYSNEIEEVEKAIEESKEEKTTGEDRWQLDRFTKTLRTNVRSRLNRTFARLQGEAKWAYILLCESSVYRCPVPSGWWLSHLEDWEQNEEQQQLALEILRDRYLVEEQINDIGQCLLRQHNLIRSVSLEHLKSLDDQYLRLEDSPNIRFTEFELREILLSEILLNKVNSGKNRSHYSAIKNWLTQYHPDENSSRIDKVRGYLQSFEHFCSLEDWINANRILSLQLSSSVHQCLLEQLGTWGYYNEQVSICEKILGKFNQAVDFRLRSCLGNAAYIRGNYDLAIHYSQKNLQEHNGSSLIGDTLNDLGNVYNALGEYNQAIQYYRQALDLNRQVENISGVGRTLRNLAIIYSNIGEYNQSSEFSQQALSTIREIDDRLEESSILTNIGLTYNFIGNHEEAIQYCQQALEISRELGDRYGEANTLGNLGINYLSVENYEAAITSYTKQLAITREIGNLQGEAIALLYLGSCSIIFERYSEALENLQSALIKFRSIGDRANEANTLKFLAQLHQKLEQNDAAAKYASQSLRLSVELGIPLAQKIRDLGILAE
jgi:nucleoside phosphorylase/Tfp pilus assembly protein PilF